MTAPRGLQLRVQRGRSEVLRRLSVGQEVVIGRSADADIAIDDERISRRHCQIRWLGSTPDITDLGSSNGSRLNGLRITQRTALHIGDRIDLGDATLLVEPPPERRQVERVPADPRRAIAAAARVRTSTLTSTRGELRALWQAERESNPLLRAALRQLRFVLPFHAPDAQEADLVFFRRKAGWTVATNTDGLDRAADEVIKYLDLEVPRADLDYIEAINFLRAVQTRSGVLERIGTMLLRTHRDWLDFPERQRDLGGLELEATAAELGADPDAVERIFSRAWIKTPDGLFALRMFFRTARGWVPPPSGDHTKHSAPPAMDPTPPPSEPKPKPKPKPKSEPTARSPWWQSLAPGLSQVFAHLDEHGVITETEVATLLGGPREQRRFAGRLDELLVGAPFRVRIESVAGIKRYVKESTG
jgi:hypothetical protein